MNLADFYESKTLAHQKPWMYKTLAEVEDWCKRANLNANITKHDLLISANTTVKVRDSLLVDGKLPVAFRSALDGFRIENTNITTLEGSMPSIVNFELTIHYNERLTSLKGLEYTSANNMTRVEVDHNSLTTLDFLPSGGYARIDADSNMLGPILDASMCHNRYLNVQSNSIERIQGFNGNFISLANNPVKSLRGLPASLESILIPDNAPLLDLAGLEKLEDIGIFNKNFTDWRGLRPFIDNGLFKDGSRVGMLRLQTALVDAGYDKLAWRGEK